MSTFRDDIIRFLTDEGFIPGRDGLWPQVLSVAEPQRLILPVEICATSPQEAETQARDTERMVLEIKEKTGQMPLIMTEDRWLRQTGMMKARLLAHLGRHMQVYARNCEVRRIEKGVAAEFLGRCHSYGDAACRYRYGMFLKRHTGHLAAEGMGQALEAGTLVAVATFSNARKSVKGDKVIRSYEWTRYASLPELRVSGGMGKLLRAFIEEAEPDDIMSYADLEWSEGAVYEQLGFAGEADKEAVMFRVDPRTWERVPLRAGAREEEGTIPGTGRNLFFMNFGSRKYRLKLTEYPSE